MAAAAAAPIAAAAAVAAAAALDILRRVAIELGYNELHYIVFKYLNAS